MALEFITANVAGNTGRTWIKHSLPAPGALMLLRSVLFNASPFFKRLLYFDPTLYSFANYIPAALLAGCRIQRSSILPVGLMVMALLGYSVVRGGVEYPLLVFATIWIFSPQFKRIRFGAYMTRMIPFFMLAAAYGGYQRMFGYTAYELGWIRSGLGAVSENGYFVTDTVRPFSLFAGVPEFGFFVALYLYYFHARRSAIGQIICWALLGVIGSRGVLVATAVAYFFLLRSAKHESTKIKAIVEVLVVNLLVYLMVFFLYPLYIQPYIDAGSSRLLVYGTLNARVEIAAALLSGISVDALLIGFPVYTPTVDNMYLYLLANYGIFSLLLFIVFLAKQINDAKSRFFVGIVAGYALYADVLLSAFLMFNFVLAIRSGEGSERWLLKKISC